jgi:hypothetical protein
MFFSLGALIGPVMAGGRSLLRYLLSLSVPSLNPRQLFLGEMIATLGLNGGWQGICIITSVLSGLLVLPTYLYVGGALKRDDKNLPSGGSDSTEKQDQEEDGEIRKETSQDSESINISK